MTASVEDLEVSGPELGALRAVLADAERAGVIVLGGPGAGKTTLVRAALAGGTGVASMTLQCGAALVDVPYGALAPFLTELEDIRGPVDAVGAVQRHLEMLEAAGPAGTSGLPVIVVEDCHFIDPASAFVLALLVQNREAVLLATSIGLRGGSGLSALVDTGLLATVTIPPLGPVQTRALCSRLVGTAPTAGAVSTILGMTGGSPRLTGAFVRSALDQGIVVRSGDPAEQGGDDAPWTLLRPAPAVDERLTGVVETMYSELTAEQQDAVTMLALAGRLPGAQLRAVAGDQATDLVETHTTRTTDDGMVALAAELYGEVLRVTTPPGRGAALFDLWASTGGSAMRPPAHSVSWAVDNGRQVTDEDRAAAGYEHLATGDLSAAWHLLGRHEEPGTDHLVVLRAAVMIAAARTWSGRADLIEVADASTDEQVVAEAVAVLVMDLVHRGVEATAGEALRAVWRELEGRARRRGEAVSAVPGPVARWCAALHLLDDAEAAPRLLDLSAALVADPGTRPALLCLAHWQRRRLLARQGRLVEAVGEATRAYDVISRSTRLTALMGGHATIDLVTALLEVGDLEAAERVLDDQRSGPARRWHDWSGTVGALQGMLEVSRGRPAPAREALRGAALDLERWDPAHLRPLVLAAQGLVTSRSAVGRGTPGGSLVSRVREGGRRGATEEWLLALGIADLVDGIGADEVAGPTPVWRYLLDDPALDPYPVVRWELLLVAVAVRGPADDHEELLACLHRAASHVDGPRAAVIGAAVDPTIETDWVRLTQRAGAARSAGDLALAADVWARVVHLHHAENDLRRRGEALRHLQDAVEALGGVPSRHVRAALDLGALSVREREIVLLAQAGHRTAEIAAMLVVSPRTVEGHLYRAFNKLGISDRTELRTVRV